MYRLYNSGQEWPQAFKKLRKFNYLLPVTIVIFLSIMVSACHRNAAQVAPAGVDTGDEKQATNSIAEADRLYAQREDLAKARLAVTVLRQARTADYGNFDAAWKLARANYYLGTHSDGDEADNAFREGIEAGKAAVQLQGNRAEGHFWLGANYGGVAERSTLAGLSSVEDIRNEMDAVIKIDEKFQNGSAYMALGQLYMRAPRVLGGDTPKAIQYLQKAAQIGPDNALIKLNLAEAYHIAGRDGESRKQIDELLAMTPNPDYLPEHKDAVEKAKELQKKLK
jgi:tetratricopeptide (TPR) repeat protein